MPSPEEVGPFQAAAALVKALGNTELANGRKLSFDLCFGGVDLWQACAPMLAVSHFAKIVSGTSSKTRLGQAGLWLRHAKAVIELQRLRLATPNTIQPLTQSNWLLLGFSRYIYTETLEPLRSYISGEHDTAPLVLSDERASSLSSFDRQSVLSQLDKGIWSLFRVSYQRLVTLRHRLFHAREIERLLLLVKPEIQADVEAILRWLFYAQLPYLILLLHLSAKILAIVDPKVVVSCDVNDPRVRIFQQLANIHGIATIDVPFGFYGKDDTEWRFQLASVVAVTGQYGFDVMKGHGVPTSKLRITGSPRYDKAYTWIKDDEVAQTRRDLGCVPGKKMLLFASQPFYFGAFESLEIRDNMILALAESVDHNPNVQLLVKPHPLEDISHLKKLFRAHPRVIVASGGFGIRSLIAACDAFVTFYSQTAFDALVLDKPVMNLAYLNSYTQTGFENWQATFIARSKDQIEEFTLSLATDKVTDLISPFKAARDRLLEGWFMKLDGNASRRIVELAASLAKLNVYTSFKGT